MRPRILRGQRLFPEPPEVQVQHAGQGIRLMDNTASSLAIAGYGPSGTRSNISKHLRRAFLDDARTCPQQRRGGPQAGFGDQGMIAPSFSQDEQNEPGVIHAEAIDQPMVTGAGLSRHGKHVVRNDRDIKLSAKA